MDKGAIHEHANDSGLNESVGFFFVQKFLSQLRVKQTKTHGRTHTIIGARLAKNTPIRRIVFREIRVSRHHGGPLEHLSGHHSTLVLRGLMRILTWTPIMPRGASLSGSGFKFFQSGHKPRPLPKVM